MSDNEGRPVRPLPPEHCPSPLDRLDPLAHGLALERAREWAQKKFNDMRECGAQDGPSLFRLRENLLVPVVDQMLGKTIVNRNDETENGWTPDELKANVGAWWQKRRDEQAAHVLAARTKAAPK